MRFGLDHPGEPSEVPHDLDDLAWNHVVKGAYAGATAIPDTTTFAQPVDPGDPDGARVTWAANGAHMARCFMQWPASVAFHAQALLPDTADGNGHLHAHRDEVVQGRRLWPATWGYFLDHMVYADMLRPADITGCSSSSRTKGRPRTVPGRPRAAPWLNGFCAGVLREPACRPPSRAAGRTWRNCCATT